MKVFNSIQSFTCDKRTIATIGTFDGVHLGHRKILDKLLKAAEDSDYESLLLTFFPHPRMVVQPEADIKLLNTLEEKKELLENIGLDNLVIHPFDIDFSNQEAEEFVKSVLVDRFNIKKIIIGYDHRFGKNRSADINDLIRFGKKYNFEVEQIEVKELNDVSISSTKIRNALHDGKPRLANSYLGYNYMLGGTIVMGKQLGRTIGYPTANIHISESYKQIPKIGVYAVTSIIQGKKICGMMNIGFNPTVAGKKMTIEVNFFDFNEDLYGDFLQIEVLERLRDEKKFESLQELKNQLAKDALSAKSICKTE